MVKLVYGKRIAALLCCLLMISLLPTGFLNAPQKTYAAESDFLHPGMLFTKEDLEQIMNNVATRDPQALVDWNLLQTSPLAQLFYAQKFPSVVYRNAPSNAGISDLNNGSTAAFLHAIQWVVTGDQSYANKAIEILNGWANNLTSIQGHDAQLAASLNGYKLLNAAEIIRYTDAGWSEDAIAKFSKMIGDVFYPLTSTYGQVNGGWANGNWDAADIVFNLCYGIWSGNETIYNEAVDYYKNGAGNGSIMHYIQTDDGQLQESGRDQGHAQLGIGLLAMAAEIGWTQRDAKPVGADMYSYPDDTFRLLKGIEYTAKYNLGYDVPYTPIPGVGYTLEDMGKGYSWMSGLKVSPVGRGRFSPIYQQIYNFYTHDIRLKDYELSYTGQVISREPIDLFSYDWLPFGSLLFGNDTEPKLEEWGKLTTVVIQNVNQELKDSNNSYLKVSDGQTAAIVSENTTEPPALFVKEYTGTGNQFAFKSLQTGYYLSVKTDGSLLADSPSVGTTETFAYIDNGSRGNILSIANNKFVGMDAVTKTLKANLNSVTNDYGRWNLLYPFDPPVTKATIAPVLNNGNRIVSKEPATLTLEVKSSTSGQTNTRYSLDQGKTWKVYEGPIKFDKKGTYKVWYGTVDKSVGVERAKSIIFHVIENG